MEATEAEAMAKKTPRSTHLAFMKFISEMYGKRQARCQAQRPTRRKRLSGSMRTGSVIQRPQNKMPRRASLGVLPGAIGIGAGFVDYPHVPTSSKF